MQPIIPSNKSVIVAADVPNLVALESLSEAMVGVQGIGGFKLGFTLGLQDLARAVNVVKRKLGGDFPIIYDHQKAGNDIPETGPGFAKVVKDAGVNSVILFPFAGPATQEAWTRCCLYAGLQVITGGIMTHKEFLVSEGGYIADEAVEQIYRNACEWSTPHFVVPGTKLDWVTKIRGWLVEELGEGNFVLYAPGFIAQGGVISECGQAAGDKWHPIVGTAIYKQPNAAAQRRAAIEMTSQILAEVA